MTTLCNCMNCMFNGHISAHLGECAILTDTDFGERICPFFKSKQEQQKNDIKTIRQFANDLTTTKLIKVGVRVYSTMQIADIIDNLTKEREKNEL